MSKNNSKDSGRVNDQETTVEKTPVPETPIVDVVDDTSTESLQSSDKETVEHTTVVDDTPAEPPVEEKPVVDPAPTYDPIGARAAGLVRPFAQYATAMGANVPQDRASLHRHQRTLMGAFTTLLDVDSGAVFKEAWNQVLALWKEGQDGAFNASRSLYRGVDTMPVDYDTRIAFLSLLHIVDAVYDEAKRATNIRDIDLNIALPEIAYFDRRGYLASYVRRFV